MHLNGGATTVIDGLKDPQGLLLEGDDLYVLDAAARELVGYSLKTRIADNDRVEFAGRRTAGRHAEVSGRDRRTAAGTIAAVCRPDFRA